MYSALVTIGNYEFKKDCPDLNKAIEYVAKLVAFANSS